MFLLVLGLVGLVILGLAAVVIGSFFSIWLQAFSAKADVSFFNLIGMRLRKVDTRQIVQSKITAAQAGLTEITTGMLESHYLAQGRVPAVVRAMIPVRPRVRYATRSIRL